MRLVYFLTQFQPLFLYIFSSFSLAQPFTFSTIYTVIFSASKPGGGILFAAAFWSIARMIESKQLRYVIISAYGLALIFASDQAFILVNRIYPPFGLVTVSFFGLASYLVLMGIYYSAISISEDSKLLRSIRSVAVQ